MFAASIWLRKIPTSRRQMGKRFLAEHQYDEQEQKDRLAETLMAKPRCGSKASRRFQISTRGRNRMLSFDGG